MGILNTFIEQASNIWWGIVMAVVVTGALYLIIYVLQGGSKSFSPLGFLFAVPLLPLLAFQFYLLFGAVGVKHSCSEAATWIDVFVPEHSADGSFSRENIDEAIRQLVTAFPSASTFIDANNISLDNDNTLGEALTNKVQTYLSWFIFRRVMWSVLFIGIAGFCIYTTMDKKRTRSRDIPTGAQTGRRYISNNSRKRR